MRRSEVLAATCLGMCSIGVFFGATYLINMSIRVLSVESPRTVQKPVLFAFDDYSIPFRKNLFLTLERPAKYPQNPVVRRGPDGSPDSGRTQFHGSVLKVNGQYKMWYVA